MNTVVTIIILIFVLIWASRVEMGINEIKATTKRIEAELNTKKEKK
jgi:hypothetical protein